MSCPAPSHPQPESNCGGLRLIPLSKVNVQKSGLPASPPCNWSASFIWLEFRHLDLSCSSNKYQTELILLLPAHPPYTSKQHLPLLCSLSPWNGITFPLSCPSQKNGCRELISPVLLDFFIAFKSFFSSGHLSCLNYNRNLLIGLDGLNCCPGAYLTPGRLWTCLCSWTLACFPVDGIKGTSALHWLPGALSPTAATISFVGSKFWYPFSGSQLVTHLISEPWPCRESELDPFFPHHAPATPSTGLFFSFFFQLIN